MLQDVNLAAYLKSIPMFKILNDAECMDLVRTFSTETFKQDRVICREGEPSKAMYIIESGRVRVYKETADGGEEELDRLGPRTVIGEMSLIDELPCSASVAVVESSASVYRIERAGFNLLRTNLQPAAFKVIRYLAEVLCGRLRSINKKIEGFYSDPDASLRAMQARRAGSRTGTRSRSYTPPPIALKELGHPPGADSRKKSPELQDVPEYNPKMGADEEKSLLYFLSRLPLTKGMDWKELRVMAGVLKASTYKDGMTIFKEGDIGDSFNIVGRGAVAIRKRMAGDDTKLLATATPGRIFGEVSLIDGKRRSASCIAIGETLLFSLNKPDFDALFHANNAFAFHLVDRIASTLSLRVRAADDSFMRIFARPEDTIQELKKRLDEVLQSLDGGISDEKLMRMVKFKTRR